MSHDKIALFSSSCCRVVVSGVVLDDELQEYCSELVLSMA